MGISLQYGGSQPLECRLCGICESFEAGCTVEIAGPATSIAILDGVEEKEVGQSARGVEGAQEHEIG